MLIILYMLLSSPVSLMDFQYFLMFTNLRCSSQSSYLLLTLTLHCTYSACTNCWHRLYTQSLHKLLTPTVHTEPALTVDTDCTHSACTDCWRRLLTEAALTVEADCTHSACTYCWHRLYSEPAVTVNTYCAAWMLRTLASISWAPGRTRCSWRMSSSRRTSTTWPSTCSCPPTTTARLEATTASDF